MHQPTHNSLRTSTLHRVTRAITGDQTTITRPRALTGSMLVPAGTTNMLIALATLTGPHVITAVDIASSNVFYANIAGDVLYSATPDLDLNAERGNSRFSKQVTPRVGLPASLGYMHYDGPVRIDAQITYLKLLGYASPSLAVRYFFVVTIRALA